jgi:hypothetical protein
MKYYFEYDVSVWEEDIDEEKNYRGVTYGDTYHEALDNILEFFGEKNLNSVKIEPWDNEGCLILSKEVLDEMRKDVI